MATDDKGPYIELNAFLKMKGAANSGGEAKHIIRSGEVLVNGEVETRNKRKLRAGDKVTLGSDTITVAAEEIKP